MLYFDVPDYNQRHSLCLLILALQRMLVLLSGEFAEFGGLHTIFSLAPLTCLITRNVLQFDAHLVIWVITSAAKTAFVIRNQQYISLRLSESHLIVAKSSTQFLIFGSR